MRRFIFSLLLVFILLVIFSPNSSDQWVHIDDANPGNRDVDFERVWQMFQRLITAVHGILYLLAELILYLLNSAWQATPLRYKVMYGILFAGVGILAFVGLLTLGAAHGLLRRLLG